VTIAADALPGSRPDAQRRQPRGLGLLFFAEMWERFSYYGMRALLVLFLIDTATGGFGWTQERASRLYGWYTGLVYLTPIVGGWLADRYLGTARALLIGGAVIAAGHFTMALETVTSFYAGLGLIVIGTGFFKANVSTLVGQLYEDNDPRRDAGFTIFYMGINLGGFLGPLVCGWLAADPRFGWSWGFAAAGVGMLLGLLLFSLLRKKHLGELGMTPSARAGDAGGAAKQPLTPDERDRVGAIIIVSVFVTFFWLAFEQAGSSINVFTQEKTRRTVDGALGALLPNGEIPAAWFQSVNSFFIIICAPLMALLWQKLGRRQPSTPAKMAIGLALVGLGFALLVPGAYGADRGTLASPWFIVGLYLCHSVGELCLSPVGLSFVTKVAPLKFASALMGVWFLANFLANLIGGYIAGTVEAVARGEYGTLMGGQADFFLFFVVVSLAAAGLLAVLVRPLLRKMHGRG
jgi:POT family proton-dependent oligopeptide transporter